MSSALYKFLQKAVLEGKPGAEALKARYTGKARNAIIDRLARVGTGKSLFEHMPISEAHGGDVLKKALAEAREHGSSPSYTSDGEARDMLLEWMMKRPGEK